MLDILNFIWNSFYLNYFNFLTLDTIGKIGAIGWIAFGLIGTISSLGLIYLKDKNDSFEHHIWIFSLSFSLLFPGLYGLFLDISEHLLGSKLPWIFYEPKVRVVLYPAITAPILFVIILILRYIIKKIKIFLGLEKKYKY